MLEFVLSLEKTKGRIPADKLKRGLMQDTLSCPHCGGDVEALRNQYEKDIDQAWAATENVRRVLAQNGLLDS